MFNFIVSLPIWLRWILRVLFIVWAFEAFLAPFRINIILNTFKSIETNTVQIKGYCIVIKTIAKILNGYTDDDITRIRHGIDHLIEEDKKAEVMIDFADFDDESKPSD